MTAAIDYLDRAIASFDLDPASGHYQQGYRAALVATREALGVGASAGPLFAAIQAVGEVQVELHQALRDVIEANETPVGIHDLLATREVPETLADALLSTLTIGHDMAPDSEGKEMKAQLIAALCRFLDGWS